MAEQTLNPGCLPQLHGPVRFDLIRAFFDEPNGRGLAGTEFTIASSVFLARRMGQL